MCELRADWWSPGGGAESPEGNGPYGSPPGPYFSMKKSRQKSLGECPEPPDASVHPARKAKGRLPGAGLDDAYKVPQAHFYVGTADRVPLPRCGEGGRGCGAERRLWRMQRGGAPAAVEKNEQASSAKFFSGTARRWGQMRLRLLLERICAQYGFGFFVQEKSKFVSSTASDRKGVVKGESVPLDRVLPTFARTKVGPRRVGVQAVTPR